MKNAQKTFKKYTKKKKKNKIVVYILLFVLFLGTTDAIGSMFSATPPLDDGGLGPMETDPAERDIDEGGGIPDIDEDPDAVYLWYQMVFQFVPVTMPEAPLDPLGFTPAYVEGEEFPDFFETSIYPVYWYGVPPEVPNIPLDGTQVFSTMDYPVLVTDTLNQNYSIWTSKYSINQ